MQDNLVIVPARPSGAYRVEAIIVHTAADPKGLDTSAANLRKYHQQVKGWKDIGYHRVYRINGLVEAGRHLDDDTWLGWDEIGAHVHGGNTRAVGVVFAGNGDLKPLTPEQMVSGCIDIARLCQQFQLLPDRVLGHREAHEVLGTPIAYKTCPGKLVDMDEIRSCVAFELGAMKPRIIR